MLGYGWYIMATVSVLCGLAYLLQQQRKRVKQAQLDFDARMEAEYPELYNTEYDIGTCVYSKDRCCLNIIEKDSRNKGLLQL